MKITTTTDQRECIEILTQLNAIELFRPLPPCQVRDGILNLGPDAWLVGSYAFGSFVFHLLEETTKAEAWKFFDTMHGKPTTYANPTMHFVEPLNRKPTASPVNN